MKKILLVDDEQNVLNALRRELKDHYDIVTFDNPAAALEHCKNTQFDLVIADYKMAGMNGVEFLEQFGQLQPDASRLMLSGQADINALIRIINETHIYRFLSKPWEKAELLNSIGQALDYRDAILGSRLQTDSLRDRRPTRQPRQADAPFQIVLAESDDFLLSLMSRELADDKWHERLYGVIQQEINPEVPTKEFKCVVDSLHSAQAVLAHVKSNQCDLIISAQTLSDMEGINLLREVRNSLPDVALVLLCDDLDKSMLSQVFNEAEMRSLLLLPWAANELRANASRRAWNLHQLKTAAIQALASRELAG
ncbi:MAG: response regulator [Gammaproteobacteria bacterium]|nr:response regulator [Gammaproteobacteria bacterium]